jgi:hypothetical protein
MTYTVGRYTTRDGRTAVVLCDDAPGITPLIGYVIVHYKHSGVAFVCSHSMAWNDDGQVVGGDNPMGFDLIGPEGFEPEPPDVETVPARGEYARLDAAAPDMLAALKEAFAELQCVRDYIEDASRGRLKYRGESDISVMATGDLARVDATIDAARAAIAKAEGRA